MCWPMENKILQYSLPLNKAGGQGNNPLYNWKYECNFWFPRNLVVPWYPQRIGPGPPADTKISECLCPLYKWHWSMHTVIPLHLWTPKRKSKTVRYLLKKIHVEFEPVLFKGQLYFQTLKVSCFQLLLDHLMSSCFWEH